MPAKGMPQAHERLPPSISAAIDSPGKHIKATMAAPRENLIASPHIDGKGPYRLGPEPFPYRYFFL
jgi:hypothetical protein